MRIAVVSKDGVHVDGHFGQAERFLIYEIDHEGKVLLTVNQVHPLSENNPEHGFNEKGFAGLLEALAGCRKVYCTKIGTRPAEELVKAGIEPVIYRGVIEAITIRP